MRQDLPNGLNLYKGGDYRDYIGVALGLYKGTQGSYRG